MTQGRKSRTVLAIGCVLAALVAGALAPAFAGAQAAAQQEYELGPIGGNGGGQGGSAQDPGGTTSDGGSGTPIVLIGLAAVAALCAGVAVWRLRERPGERTGKVGPGAPEAASETQ